MTPPPDSIDSGVAAGLPKPETLLAYASAFEKPYRNVAGGVMHEPGEPARAAAKALRIVAALRTPPAVASGAKYPSTYAMMAAVELEIEAALGRVQTVTIGHMIQKAIDAALARSPSVSAGAIPNYKFPYQQTFDAIATATDVLSGPPNQKQLSISVKKFQEAFNNHRDKRALALAAVPQGQEPPKRIEVDIGAALTALQDNPELASMMNEMVGGPALVEAQAEIERLNAVIASRPADAPAVALREKIGEIVFNTLSEHKAYGPSTSMLDDDLTRLGNALADDVAAALAAKEPEAGETRGGDVFRSGERTDG